MDVRAPFVPIFYSSPLLSLGLTVRSPYQCVKHSSSFHILSWILIQIKQLLMANVNNYILSTWSNFWCLAGAELSGEPADRVSSLLFSVGWPRSQKNRLPLTSLSFAAVLRRKENNTAIEILKALLMARRIHLMYSVGLPNRSISKGKCVIVIWSINYKKKVSF